MPARSLGEAILKIRTDHAQALAGVNAVQGGIQSLANGVRNAGFALSAFGAVTTATFTSIAGAGLKTFAGIEQALQEAFSIAGYDKGSKAVNEITRNVEELGKETQFTQQAIASGVRQIVSAGVVGPKAIDGMIRSAAELAATIGTELPTAVGLVVSSVNSIPSLAGKDRLDPKNIDTIVNHLTDLQGAARIESPDLEVMFKRLGGLFSVVKGGQNEVRNIMAAIGALNQVTGNAATTVTGVREAFVFLERGWHGNTRQAVEARAALDKLGLTMEDLDPRKKGIIVALRNLAKTGLAESSNAATLFGRTGTEAIRIWMKAIPQIEAIRERMDNMKDATARTAENLDTLHGDTIILISSLENLRKQIGKAIVDMGFRKILVFLKDILNQIADWVRDNPKIVAGFIAIGTAIGAAATGLGAMLIVFGTLLGSIGGIIGGVLMIKAALAAAGVAGISLGAVAVILGKLILISLGVAVALAGVAAVVALIGKALWDNREKVIELWKAMHLGDIAMAIWKGMIATANALKDAIVALAQFVSEKVEEALALPAVQNFFGTIGKWIAVVAPVLEAFLKRLAATASVVFPMLLQAFGPVVSALIDLGGAFLQAWSDIFDVFGEMFLIMGLKGESSLGGLGTALLIVAKIVAFVTTAVLKLSLVFLKTFGWLATWGVRTLSYVIVFMAKVGEWIGKLLDGLGELASKLTGGVVGKALGWLGGLFGKKKKVVEAAGNARPGGGVPLQAGAVVDAQQANLGGIGGAPVAAGTQTAVDNRRVEVQITNSADAEEVQRIVGNAMDESALATAGGA